MNWLRARMHLFSLVLLPLALVWLWVDWALGAKTSRETLVAVLLTVGGLGMLGLKLSVLRRGRDDKD